MNTSENPRDKVSRSKPIMLIPESVAKRNQYISAAAGAILSGALILSGSYIKDKISADEDSKKSAEPAEMIVKDDERGEISAENLCQIQNEKFHFSVTPAGFVKIEALGENLEQTYITATENFEKCTNDFLANNSQKYSAFVNKFQMNITLDDTGKYHVTYSLPLVMKKENERHITRIYLQNGNHKSLANGKNIFTDVEGKNLQTTLIMNVTSPK